MQADIAIPILPSRSVVETTAFYKALGFEGGPHDFDSSYAILRRRTIELHFFTHTDLDPAASSAGCYLRVLDVDGLHREWSLAKLPRTGLPRMEHPANKPWGLREFALVDLDGNLVRVGQILEQ